MPVQQNTIDIKESLELLIAYNTKLQELGLITDLTFRDDMGAYLKIQLNADAKSHIGIGLHAKDIPYFFHNSHSGSIAKPSEALGSVWNFKEGKYSDKPKGWYTLSTREIEHIIDNIISK